MRAGRRYAALLVGLLLAMPAGADYKDSYSRGLNAAKSGDWAEVRQRMQEAIADRSDPAERVRLYGQRWDAYVPQYYLGLASFKLGDCASALAQWRSAPNMGVIGALPDLKAEQQRDQAKCEEKLTQQAPAKPPVEPDKPKVEPTPALPIKPTPTPPRPVTPTPVPQEPVAPKPAASIAERVPAALLEAVKAWLAGRYADVVKINPEGFSDSRAKAQAFLIRAAARQLQSELDGNAGLLESARADVRAARVVDARLTPDQALFSPRFRAFFAATR
ncbi:MAG: hypothetical protein ABI411_01415 [Tahibacter sp.]